MHLLLESHENRITPFGMFVSVVIHAALVALIIVAYRQGPRESGLMDQFVTYLVPPDKPANRSAVEQQGWSGQQANQAPDPNGARGGGASLSTGPVVPDSGKGHEASGLSIDLPKLLGDSILMEIDVDSAVKRYEWSAAPDYPLEMLHQQIQGSAFVLYVVDTSGVADTTSFQVLSATHNEFAEAVRQALPRMRFRPALLAGHKVRQLVQQNFTFRIERPDSVLPPRDKPPQ
jgi:TonB family protein